MCLLIASLAHTMIASVRVNALVITATISYLAFIDVCKRKCNNKNAITLTAQSLKAKYTEFHLKALSISQDFSYAWRTLDFLLCVLISNATFQIQSAPNSFLLLFLYLFRASS